MILTRQEWWKFEEKTPDFPKEILIRLKGEIGSLHKGYYYPMSKIVENKNESFLIENILYWTYPVIPIAELEEVFKQQQKAIEELFIKQKESLLREFTQWMEEDTGIELPDPIFERFYLWREMKYAKQSMLLNEIRIKLDPPVSLI